jgi:hypothetical protein
MDHSIRVHNNTRLLGSSSRRILFNIIYLIISIKCWHDTKTIVANDDLDSRSCREINRGKLSSRNRRSRRREKCQRRFLASKYGSQKKVVLSTRSGGEKSLFLIAGCGVQFSVRLVDVKIGGFGGESWRLSRS